MKTTLARKLNLVFKMLILNLITTKRYYYALCTGKRIISYLDGHFHLTLNVNLVDSGGSSAGATGSLKLESPLKSTP